MSEAPAFIKKPRANKPRYNHGEETRTAPNSEGVYYINGYPVTESKLPRRVGEICQ